VNIKETIIQIKQMEADGIIGRYAIGGAVAATFYLEPGATEDVDVFIQLDPLLGRSLVTIEPIDRYLEEKGYQFNVQGWPVISGWPVQFVPVQDPLEKEALDQSVEKDFDGVPVRVFTAEHLAAIAFKLGRPKDKVRLSQFLEARALEESLFSAILERHDLLERWIQFKRQFAG
jgi:hypothetical protein